MNYLQRCFVFSLCLFTNIFTSQVDTSLNISTGEQTYNSCRIPYAQQSIKNFIGYPNLSSDVKLPRIDFCASGGGARALLSSLGFSMGAQEIKLLDMATSFATLSGSVWFVAMWMLSRTDPATYKNIIQQKLVDNEFYHFGTLDLDAIATKLIFKYKETGRFNTADLWGAILSDRFMDNMLLPNGEIVNKQYITMADTRAQLEYHKNTNNPYYPFPIYTSSITCVKPYQWLEINPYYCGSDYLRGYVSTQSFGSPFNNGFSQFLYHEESISSFMGLCGSAYSVSFWDVLKNECGALIQKLKEKGCSQLAKLIQNFLLWFYQNKANIDPARLLASHYCNFTYNMPNLPLNFLTNIELADAGMSYNLPFDPLLKRRSDIIIVCDASSNCPDLTFTELKYAKAYADAKGYKFPDLTTYTPIGDYGAVFENDDPQTPTIIYFQNIIKESTFKFNYTQQELDQVCYSMNYMVAAHKTDIANTIIRKINNINGLNKKMSLGTKVLNKLKQLMICVE